MVSRTANGSCLLRLRAPTRLPKTELPTKHTPLPERRDYGAIPHAVPSAPGRVARPRVDSTVNRIEIPSAACQRNTCHCTSGMVPRTAIGSPPWPVTSINRIPTPSCLSAACQKQRPLPRAALCHAQPSALSGDAFTRRLDTHRHRTSQAQLANEAHARYPSGGLPRAAIGPGPRGRIHAST